MEEYLDIFDENNNYTGAKEERKKVHELGLWHREVQIWVVNENNEFLIQKRSPNKKIGANKWSLTAGHVPSGEEMIEGALRECEEELGFKDLKTQDFYLIDVKKCESSKKNNIQNNCYKYCYILKTNKKINEFILQEEEVSEVKYITLEKLKNLSDEEKESFTSLFKKDDFIKSLENVESKLKEL